MPTRPGFLQPKPKIDEAEWADAQARTVRRLHAFFSPELAAAEEAAEAEAAARASGADAAAADRTESQGGVAVAEASVDTAADTDSRPGLKVSGVAEAADGATPRPIVVYDGAAEIASIPLPAPLQGSDEAPSDMSHAGLAADADLAPAGPEAPLVGVMNPPTDDLGWDDDRPLVGVFDEAAASLADGVDADALETPHDGRVGGWAGPPGEGTVEPDDHAAPAVLTEPATPVVVVGSVEPRSPKKAVRSRAAKAKARPAKPGSPKPLATRAGAKVAAKVGAVPKAAARKPARKAAAGPSLAAIATPTPAPTKATPRAKATAIAAAKPAVAAVAHCPYCATLLDPAPTANRRCERCRHRIMVKKVNGAPVYLTEAALQVFDDERKRVSNLARWTKERDRWLRLAATVGAPEERRAQLAKARLTDDVVAKSRKLYVNGADRAFWAARARQDWVVAGRLRREKALALHAGAGSPVPPTDDVVATFREGVAAELRGIAEIARDAELITVKCCDVCSADEGTVVRIARELKAPRLPHAGCPRGLCRCHWDLAEKDRLTVRRYLRRRSGA